MKVLVVCEDHSLDQYICKPVVERALAEVGVRGMVRVLTDPRLQGVSQLLRELPMILQDTMEQIVVVVADNDCDREHTKRKLAAAAEGDPRVVACCAMEEVEIWMLALHQKELGIPWKDVRSDCDVKDSVAVPFLRRTGRDKFVGRGRKDAMREILGSWRTLLDLCDEPKTFCSELRAAVERIRKA